MTTEFRRAVVPDELRSLVAFDHQAFHEYPGDWFDRQTWLMYETWWMVVDNKRVGCCAFERDVDFREDKGLENPRRPGSLYISTTGILPPYQGRGFGRLLKAWQVAYALHNGFTRMVTNHRKSNRRIIKLNESFGFKVIRTTPRYYEVPPESVVVMELKL